MRTLVLLVFSVVLSLTLLVGCSSFPLPLIPPPTAESVLAMQESQPIPVAVPQFYMAEGLQIHVGDFSQELGTRDLEELTVLAEEMAGQKDQLRPEQMFVLAIRLYDLGEKDRSVYWFYEAQFRAKLFLKTLDPAQLGGSGSSSLELLESYDAFTKLAGEYINGYAGCDVDNWEDIAQSVRDDNLTAPALDRLFPEAAFVAPSEWQRINDEVGAGLGGLIEYLAGNGDTIRQQRESDNSDALYCQ